MPSLTPGRIGRRLCLGTALALAALKGGGWLPWPWWAVTLPAALPFVHVALAVVVMTLFSLPFAAATLCTRNWHPAPTASTVPRPGWQERRRVVRAIRRAADAEWRWERATLRRAKAEAKARCRAERGSNPAHAYRDYYRACSRLRRERRRVDENHRRARLRTPDNPEGHETLASVAWQFADWPWETLADAAAHVLDEVTTDRAEAKRRALATMARQWEAPAEKIKRPSASDEPIG